MTDVPANSTAAARRVPQLSATLVGAKLLDFGLYVLLARWLTIEEFGLYTLALSFTLLFMMLADFGLSTVFAREVCKSPDAPAGSMLRVSLLLKLGLGVLTVAATMGMARQAGLSLEIVAMISAVTGGMLLNSTALLFDGLLRARGRAGASGLAVLAQSAAGLFFAGILLAAGMGAQAGALAYLVAALTHAIWSAWSARELWSLGDVQDRSPRALVSNALEMLRTAAPVALPGVFVALYFRIDAVMLYFMEGESAVGFYGGAYGLFEVLLPLSAAYRVMFVPLSHRSGDASSQHLRVLARGSLQSLLLLSVGIAAFVSLESTAVLDGLLGARYTPAALALAILIWALPAAFMADLMHHLLVTQRRQLAGTIAVAGVAAFNIGLNWLVIPPFSFTGAAAATVLSEFLCFGALMYLFSRDAGSLGFMAVAWRPVLAGVVLAAVLAAIGDEFPPGVVRLMLAGIGGAALYMLLLTASRGAREDDPIPAGTATSTHQSADPGIPRDEEAA